MVKDFRRRYCDEKVRIGHIRKQELLSYIETLNGKLKRNPYKTNLDRRNELLDGIMDYSNWSPDIDHLLNELSFLNEKDVTDEELEYAVKLFQEKSRLFDEIPRYWIHGYRKRYW